jgi:hypothetical protein
VPDQEVITEVERAERQRRVEDAVHNNRRAGCSLMPDGEEFLDPYLDSETRSASTKLPGVGMGHRRR